MVRSGATEAAGITGPSAGVGCGLRRPHLHGAAGSDPRGRRTGSAGEPGGQRGRGAALRLRGVAVRMHLHRSLHQIRGL